jgi:hypothetical protein
MCSYVGVFVGVLCIVLITWAEKNYLSFFIINLIYNHIQVTFGTKKKWSSKTGDLLKEVQFI